MIHNLNFKIYIHKLLKKINHSSGISEIGLVCLNNLIKINIEKIMFGVNELVIRNNKKTVSYKEIADATSLFFSRELSSNLKSFSGKAVSTYEKNKENKVKGTRSQLSNLSLPVARIQNYMMSLSVVSRKTEKAAIVLTAICEFLISDILAKSIIISEKDKKIRITNRHIMLAIDTDKELKKLYKDFIF